MERRFLLGFVIVLSLCAPPAEVLAAASREKLVLLGTAGGPTPKRTRSAPAQALVIDDSIYLVDCGNGVARQMVLAGLAPRNLRHVFVTHHHSDHVADLVTLPLLAWADGLDTPLTLHGPARLRKAVKAGLRAVAFDVETRTVDEGRPRLGDLVRVHEFAREGLVHEDALVRVRTARVDHAPIREAYAYRFDTADWSVVISGDTAPAESLVQLARGADVLVHEVLLAGPTEVGAWLEKPLDHPLVQHVVRSHTSFRDVGRIARRGGRHARPEPLRSRRCRGRSRPRPLRDPEDVRGEGGLRRGPPRDRASRTQAPGVSALTLRAFRLSSASSSSNTSCALSHPARSVTVM